MTIKKCIKCGKLSNEMKILINSIYIDIEKDVNKDCEKCLKLDSKDSQELVRLIAKKPEIRTKNCILAALKDYPFEDCEIERHENIPINEIGPMENNVIGIFLSKSIGDFSWFYNYIKNRHQNKYNKIANIQCFEENKNFMIEFPIVLVTPPNRGIASPLNGIKYYVEDGNHRLLKWIDSGSKEGKSVETVPAFVIKEKTPRYSDNRPNPIPNIRWI